MTWDMEGLTEDLDLAMGSAQGMGEDSKQLESRPGSSQGVAESVARQELPPEDFQVTNQDAPKEELPLGSSKGSPEESRDPESMLAQLRDIDPMASKDDYFDHESMTWDMEGLTEDLDLAMGSAQGMGEDSKQLESRP